MLKESILEVNAALNTLEAQAVEDKAVHFFKRKGAPPKAAVLLKIISDNIGKTI